jgi:hypothetical protein
LKCSVRSPERPRQQVTQEIIFLEFEDVQGIKFRRKTVTARNGQQILKVTRRQLKRLEKPDDSRFTRP